MKTIAWEVAPRLPERLAGLRELALNLLWSWDGELRTLFPRLDRELWDATYQNPVAMLGRLPQEKLAALAGDDAFLAFYDRMRDHLTAYLSEATWWDKRYRQRPLVAYFSAEYGLAECLPIYSGGLGVLAAHHLKSASDLGVPLVGVGLLYQQGYFRQYLASDGWQQESYPTNDFGTLPVRMVEKDGAPLRVAVDLAGQPALVQVWRVEVGRIPLFLLDTNVDGNPREVQDVTDQLYGGNQETRIRQEIVLGVGGFRALQALGLAPAVCHMNEGHSAFLALERIRALMREHGASFAEVLPAVRAGTVFTTHTAVPAGFDVFPQALFERYLGPWARDAGVPLAEVLELGRTGQNGDFSMAALALRTAAHANGVSRIHGAISRRLLGAYLPAIPTDEVPIGHVTNGTHTWSCVSREMAGLFDRYLGTEWWRRPGQAATWDGIDAIPDEELWATHERRRQRLVAFARRRLRDQLRRRGASERDVEHARGVLDTRALTIGFARRFATYKRAGLILHDPERLRRILTNPERPVQIIFAGKAHPHDDPGKEMLRAVAAFCQRDEFRHHVVFVEDYDLVVARYLVQGCDVWLNTPRRGQEASGTSGMKVLPNGGLNVSVLDGWWCEGYAPEVGWAIGQGEDYADPVQQDLVESRALYDLLENDIVPLFFARQADGLPRPWIARMKKSMRQLTPTFSTNRMLWEYGERFYLPAADAYGRLVADGLAGSRALAGWTSRIRAAWAAVAVESVTTDGLGRRQVGEEIEVRALVRLGDLRPADVAVEVYHGAQDVDRSVREPQTLRMTAGARSENGSTAFTARLLCDRSGRRAMSVRVRPDHPDLAGSFPLGLLTWWSP